MTSLLLTALLFFSLLTGNSRAEGKYIWPLAERYGVSSSFGECRKARLHTGIDLRTAGVTGLEVRAVNDGVVYRLSVNYGGFGNALYIRHPDGLVSVYGHLERFENRVLCLQDIVARRKKETGQRYPGDMFISVPVRKGQTVAYSGESGAGLPHLHFELRRGESKPINPLSILTQHDQTPPVIRRLLFRPIGPDSLVDGGRDDVTVWLGGRGKKHVKPEPVVSGQFVVLANVFDLIDAGNHCGIHTLELWADDQLIYSMSLSELEYDRTNFRGGLVFDNRFTYYAPYNYVYQLSNRYDVKNPWQASCKNLGILDFSNERGAHTLTVKAFDDAGNCSTAAARVRSEPQAPRQTAPPAGLLKGHQGSNAPLVQVWDNFAEVWVQRPENMMPSSNQSVSAATVQIIAKGGPGQMLTLTPVERANGWLSACLPVDGSLSGPIAVSAAWGTDEAIAWTPSASTIFIIPRSGGVMQADGMRVEFPPDALYADQIFEIVETTATAMSDVPIASNLVRKVLPEGIPLDKEVMVSFACPQGMAKEDVSRCGVYEYNAKASVWRFRDNQRLGEALVGAPERYLSTFALLVDKACPRIGLLSPKPGKPLRKQGNRLVARITDVGSGIDYRTIVATIDGAEIDAEYDPDYCTLKGTFNVDTNRGAHRLVIKASDFAGNPATPLDRTL